MKCPIKTDILLIVCPVKTDELTAQAFFNREKGQTSDFISLHTLLLPAEGDDVSPEYE